MTMKHRLVTLISALSLVVLSAGAAYAETATVTVDPGTLSVTAANVTLSGLTLDGTDGTVTSAFGINSWSAQDSRGTGVGWNVTIYSTDFGIDEVQSFYNGATAGTFDLTFDTQTASGVAYNADAGAITTALEGLSNITDVTVTGTGTSGAPWIVTFVDPGKQNVEQMTTVDTNLTGGTPTTTISTTTQGRTIDISSDDQQFKIQLLDANIDVTVGNTKPTSSATALTAIPEGSGGPLKFMSSAADAGMGTYPTNPNFTLAVPAEIYIGDYTATITVTASTGP